MELKYKVHSTAQSSKEISVMMGTTPIRAIAPAVVVELVPDGHEGGSINLVAVGDPDLIKEIIATYVPGASVTATFSVAKSVEE